MQSEGICIKREEILAVYEAGPEAVVKLVTNLCDIIEKQNAIIEEQNAIIEKQNIRITQLEERVEQLESMLNKNSRNSSKPPSTDSYARNKPVVKSTRKKTGKKAGGQKGHPGTNLKKSEDPDEIVLHQVHTCSNCGSDIDLVQSNSFDSRQVFDIPPIKMTCVEHRSEMKTCPHCSHVNKADFPEDVTQPTQYGSRVKSFAIYLHDYQLLPFQRITELYQDIFGCSISPGTLVNTEIYCHDALRGFKQELINLLKQSPVINFDETGIRINGKRHWLHVAGTNRMTYYYPHKKRGYEAMDAMGVIPGYTGVAVHDGWKPYHKFDCKHSLCNAHLLRELIGISETCDQLWPEMMKDLLMCIKSYKDGMSLNLGNMKKFCFDYENICSIGTNENPPDPNIIPGKRGRKKQSKSKNLLDRFIIYKAEILRFMYDHVVPFDNNLAERDVRMVKVQQKVSGTFRSLRGAECFCLIRSYISTVKKNSRSIMNALVDLVNGKTFVPKAEC